MAQWITRLTTNQEIAGSTPARVENIFGKIFSDGVGKSTFMFLPKQSISKYEQY